MKDCDNCKAMEILADLHRRLYANYKYEELRDELGAAIASVQKPEPKSATKSGRATATCIKPGCSTKIFYDPEKKERPLYCTKHMPEYKGRNMAKVRK
jgi:hypothetical protein